MSRFFSICAFLLAVVTFVAYISTTRNAEPPLLFAQGGLAPLLRAEDAVRAERAEDALAAYRVALLRTHREGYKTAFARIRFGMSAAGKKLASKGLARGWPLLSQACLLSTDFSREAEKVEAWAFDCGQGRPEFNYPLTTQNGHRTVWGGRPTHVPLWLYRKMGSTPGRLDMYYWRFAHEAPPDADHIWSWDLNLISNPTACLTGLEIRRQTSADLRWFGSINFKVQWSTSATPSGSGLRSIVRPLGPWRLDRIIAAGQASSAPHFEAVIVRAYNPL